MDNPRFRARIAEAQQGSVDAYLDNLHDFRNSERTLEVRIVSSAAPGAVWLLIRRV